MNPHDDERLRELEQRLRDERPRMTNLELDDLRRRIDRRGASQPTNSKGSFMRSRLAITAMIVAGAFFTSSGAGLALSGVADDSAGKKQYPDVTTTTKKDETTTTTKTETTPKTTTTTKTETTTTTTPETTTTVPETTTTTPSTTTTVPSTTTTTEEESAVLGDTDESGPPETSKPKESASGEQVKSEAAVEAAQQTGTLNEDKLPFTGFVVLPMLLFGIALLAGGLLLRRSERRNN